MTTGSKHLPSPLLPLATYRLHFKATTPVHLHDWPGSAWRGGFGHALKHRLCVTRATECDGCPLLHDCIYAYIFETPPLQDAEKMRKYPHVPHPFVFNLDFPAGNLEAGQDYTLGFTLMGRGQQHLAQVISAIELAGQRGIGKHRGRLQLQHAEQQQLPDSNWQPLQPDAMPYTPTIPPMPTAFRLELLTPLRLKQNNRFITPHSFAFGTLFSNLLRRISMLTYFHTDTPLETDFAGLTRTARTLQPAATRLQWFDWSRYSSRQKQAMQLSGLLGEIDFSSEAFAPFWPYLWLGQYVHAGAITSMGFGRYRIASLPEQIPAHSQPDTATP